MLLFPLLAGILSILFIIAILFPTIIVGFISGVTKSIAFGVLEYILLFLTYLGLSFIAIFFNVCVVYTTKVRFEGGNATLFDSIKFALSKTHLILVWSLVSATVGLVLRLIDEVAKNSGKIGEIIISIMNSLLGLMWSIITIFVVPAMVYDNLGPIDAIKKSVDVLKKTWGESLIKDFSFGLVEFLFILFGLIIGVILLFLSFNLGMIGIVIVLSLNVIYFISVILIFEVANSIFNTALYVYANKRELPAGYSKEIMDNTFRRKK